MLTSNIVNIAIFIGVGAVLTIVLGLLLLPMLVRLKVGQTIREEGPRKHYSKAGTPTMGGIIFIGAMVLIFIFRSGLEAWRWIWLISFLAFGLIGFLDDFNKVVKKRNLGLTGRQKLLGQFVTIAILLVLNQLFCDRGTAIYAPAALLNGTAQPLFDLGWWYYPIIAIFMVGTVNAVNLTDGLDGLVSGVSVPVFFGFAVVATGMVGIFGLNADAVSYAAAMLGCCLGFLVFNRHPARVFMGDTGSMALGGAVVGFALIMRLELLLLGFGLVYLLEAASVMLQVASFKLTGKRLFLMSPLHHHYELKGWRETKVTAVFCLASAVFVGISLVLCVI